MKCTECGVQHQIYPTGYLFIEGNEASAVYRYNTIEELEEYLKNLMIQGSNYNVALVKEETL